MIYIFYLNIKSLNVKGGDRNDLRLSLYSVLFCKCDSCNRNGCADFLREGAVEDHCL